MYCKYCGKELPQSKFFLNFVVIRKTFTTFATNHAYGNKPLQEI
jgi:hypothetical protein